MYMKNIYELLLDIEDEMPYNKFCHLVTSRIEDELEWLDIIKEAYPKMTIKGTEEEITGLVKFLEENGYQVRVEKQ